MTELGLEEPWMLVMMLVDVPEAGQHVDFSFGVEETAEVFGKIVAGFQKQLFCLACGLPNEVEIARHGLAAVEQMRLHLHGMDACALDLVATAELEVFHLDQALENMRAGEAEKAEGASEECRWLAALRAFVAQISWDLVRDVSIFLMQCLYSLWHYSEQMGWYL